MIRSLCHAPEWYLICYFYFCGTPRAASTENLMNKKKKWIETAITWVGYSVVVIGVIILLILLRQQN